MKDEGHKISNLRFEITDARAFQILKSEILDSAFILLPPSSFAFICHAIITDLPDEQHRQHK